MRCAAGFRAFQGQDLVQTRRHARASRVLDAEAPLLRVFSGGLLMAAGNLNAGWDHFEFAFTLGTDPDAIRWIKKNLFLITRNLGDYARANTLVEDLRNDPLIQPDFLVDAATYACDLNDPLVALDLLRGAMERVPAHQATEIVLRTARLLKMSGDAQGARTFLRDISPRLPKESSADLAHVFAEVGGFGDAESMYRDMLAEDSLSDYAHAQLAHLHLARGDVESARGCCNEIKTAGANAKMIHRVHAICLMLESHWPEAEDALSTYLDDSPQDSEAWFFYAECLLRLGKNDLVNAVLKKGGNLTDEGTGSFTYQCLALLTELQMRALLPPAPIPQRINIPPALSVGLSALFPESSTGLEELSESEVVNLLNQALTALQGSRSPVPTALFPGEDDLELMPTVTSVRREAKELAWRIAWEPCEDVIEKLKELVTAHPTSPQPHCYLGELFLWLGRIDEGQVHFAQALALNDQAKWSYIGLGAVQILSGNPTKALEILDASIEVTGSPGPTLYAYRGEAHMMLGNHALAYDDLKTACDAKPERIGAWICLGLNAAKMQDSPTFTRVIKHLQTRAPGLLEEAANALDTSMDLWTPADTDDDTASFEETSVLEKALRLMRGNRASAFVTYFTEEGRLRFIPSRSRDLRFIFSDEVHEYREMFLRAMGLKEPVHIVLANEVRAELLGQLAQSREELRAAADESDSDKVEALIEQEGRARSALQLFVDDKEFLGHLQSARFNLLFHQFEGAEARGDRGEARAKLTELLQIEPDNANLKTRMATYRYVVPPRLEADIIALFQPLKAGEDCEEGQFVRIEIRDAMIIAHAIEPSGIRSALRMEHPDVLRQGTIGSASFSMTIAAQRRDQATPVTQALAAAVCANDSGEFPWILAVETDA